MSNNDHNKKYENKKYIQRNQNNSSSLYNFIFCTFWVWVLYRVESKLILSITFITLPVLEIHQFVISFQKSYSIPLKGVMNSLFKRIVEDKSPRDCCHEILEEENIQ